MRCNPLFCTAAPHRNLIKGPVAYAKTLAASSDEACPMNGIFGYGPKGYDHALGMVKARISKPAPDFTAAAVVKGKFEDITLSSFKGKYVVLFFYPLDFTFVCPTEIIAFNDRNKEFEAINTA
eukprot:sb/3475878/